MTSRTMDEHFGDLRSLCADDKDTWWARRLARLLERAKGASEEEYESRWVPCLRGVELP